MDCSRISGGNGPTKDTDYPMREKVLVKRKVGKVWFGGGEGEAWGRVPFGGKEGVFYQGTGVDQGVAPCCNNKGLFTRILNPGRFQDVPGKSWYPGCLPINATL